MKAQFLKISGHKNEKDFYKEFPTMESFMAKHGAALKKMQYGGVPFESSLAGYPNQQYNAFPKPELPQNEPVFDPSSVIQPYQKTAQDVATQGQQTIDASPIGPAALLKKSVTNPVDTGKAIQTGIGMVDKVIGGFKALKAEKAALKSARTWKDVSDISRKASETIDVDARTQLADNQKRLRKAMMPTVTGENFFPVGGVGTNPLGQAKGGGKLPTGGLKRSEDYGSKSKPYASVSKGDFAGGGRSYPIPTIQDAGDALRLAGLHNRPDVKAKVYAKYPELRKGQDGEIMNTFAPEDIYNDLGYEPMGESEPGFQPLSDSEVIKAYRSGGLIPKAFFGMNSGMAGAAAGGAGGAGGGMFSNMLGNAGQYFGGAGSASPWGAMGNVGESLASSAFGNNAGTQIGGGFGEAAGSIFGPIGGEVGKTAGALIGGFLDKNPKKTERAQKAMMKNINTMSGMSNLKQFQGGYSGVFEDGGYMSHDWQPRVITHFGGNSMRDLLRPDPMMNTLRTGGNIRSNEMGDIRIDNRGKLEPISYNPFTAGTGITSMIKGPSHDRGGVNISYNGNMVEAEGGEPISERQEGGPVGDTAAVITGDQTFNKMGAHEIPELSEYLGKKVKHIQKYLAEEDAKLNKLQTKNSKALAEFNPLTPIDKLTFNSLAMNEKGINQQYKRNALKTQSLIAYQDAINQEAERMGVDAGELSRGKIKPLPFEEMMIAQEAMNGMSLLSQFQGGGFLFSKRTPGKYIYKAGQKPQLITEESAQRDEEASKPAPSKKAVVSEAAKKAHAMQGLVPKWKREMVKAGVDPNEYVARRNAAAEAARDAEEARAAEEAKRAETASRQKPKVTPVKSDVKGTSTVSGPQPKWKRELLKQGIDPEKHAAQKIAERNAEIKAYKESLVIKPKPAASKQREVTVSPYTLPKDSGQQNYYSAPTTAEEKRFTAPTKANTSNKVAQAQATVTPTPTGSSKTRSTTPTQKKDVIVPNTMNLPGVSEADYNEAKRLYDIAKAQKTGKAVSDFQEYYHKIAPDYARAILQSAPLTAKGQREGLTNADLPSNVDAIFGPRTEQYMTALKKAEAKKAEETPEETPAATSTTTPADEDGVYETSPYKKYWWENAAAQVMPWLRKTPGEPLLGDQLAGEMYAMSHNQVEPVQARFYHPELDVPYDISFQDRLNENQATFNSLQRAAGAGNPEALSMLAGQKYGADSNVLAEQFRANQAKKDQVYSQNRATLNQAQQTNLGIADQQYVRQQQAKSNTKMAMQEALNSVASKIGQNRLENRTLQTYANMFPDFSFGKDYNIRKTGAPTTFNMPVVYNAAGDITHVALYDSDGKIYDYKELSPSESKAMAKKKPSDATPGIVADNTKNTTTTTEEKKKERNGGIVRAFKNL